MRGALIVVEGGDRCGKTTFCKGLAEKLTNQGISTQYLNFPDRKTEIGKIINNYLSSKDFNCNDETIHLLFSANRWEWVPKIKSLLNSGLTLIIDRYAFSGVAFSAAKGLDFNWCKSSDIGLPKPDRVYFMKLNLDEQQLREGFGSERYETSNFQKIVFSYYLKMEDKSWKNLNASMSQEELQNNELESLKTLLNEVKNKEIQKLWK